MFRWLIGVVLLLSLAGCGGIGQPACRGSAIVAQLQPVAQRWDDAAALAGNTPRMQLATQIAALQEIKREADVLELPACASDAKAALSRSMQATIEGYLAFLAQSPDTTVQAAFGRARTEMTYFTEATITLVREYP